MIHRAAAPGEQPIPKQTQRSHAKHIISCSAVRVVSQKHEHRVFTRRGHQHHRQLKVLVMSILLVGLSSIVRGFILPSPTASKSNSLASRPHSMPYTRSLLFSHDRNKLNYKNVTGALENASSIDFTQSLEESAAQYKQTLADACIMDSKRIPICDDYYHTELGRMGACEEEDYDGRVRELFISLVKKIRKYNPDAVEGIDLSTFNHDESLEIDDFTPTKDISTSTEPAGELLIRAYQYAKAAHKGQCRKSGEPYITHPLGVAHIIADLKLDISSVVTALLHDTVEDTPVTLQNITTIFSSEISHLVDGVTKVGKLPFKSIAEQQSENYRKLILAMSEDIRVVLVKLADRTHNMRTLQFMSSDKQKRIARETMEIYGPLAHRLGIHWLKTELEDACFRYLNAEKYEMVKGHVQEKSAERKEYEHDVVKVLEKQMRDAGLGEDKTLFVSGRTKGLYSIYSKMKRQGIEFEDVFDKIGFRIIVSDVATCYQALGIIHSNWKPAGTGKIKDYIALPKENGYRSLHTTIIGPRGKRIEVQIRTWEMHEIAESGIAAHWMYKQNKQGKNSRQDSTQFTWLRELLAEVQRQNDPVEFIDSLKEDLFAREVFVFSPKGELFALAAGSSVLDFAYAIHSQLGNHCGGAKVNGKIVSLRHLVQNGDTIEILRNHNQTPKRDWLRFVRTSKAKSRIRAYLKHRRREKSIMDGKAIIEQGLRKHSDDAKKSYVKRLHHILSSFKVHDENELLINVGHGRITVESVINVLFGSPAQNHNEKGDMIALQTIENQNTRQTVATRASSKTGILVGKERNILLAFCKSCRPLYGEQIRGVVTKGKGVKVHRQNCEHILEADDRRIIEVKWDHDSLSVALKPVLLEVLCEDTPGVLTNICHAISSTNFSIESMNLRKLSKGRGLVRLEVMLRTADDMEKVMSKIKQGDNIISVQRK